MKRIMNLSAALLFMAGTAAAQPGTGADSQHRQGPGGKGDKGAFMQQRHGFGREERLKLTDDQRQQLKKLNDSYHQQLAALQGNDKISLGDYKKQLAALHKSHEEQVQGVYTDEQKKQLAEFKNKRNINMQAAAAARLERLKLELNLTDEQVGKIKGQQEQMHSQLTALHENSALLPEQKREELKTLFAKEKDAFKTVLTPDQLSKLDSLHKDRFNERGGFGGRYFGGPGEGPGDGRVK
jgi:Spy/CpxP family protein refolding chaperone